jgi:hypothetical protein
MGFSLPLSEVVGSNPASPSLGFLTNFLEDFFGLKRFQGDGGVAGLGKERRNRYGGGNYERIVIFHSFSSLMDR